VGCAPRPELRREEGFHRDDDRADVRQAENAERRKEQEDAAVPEEPPMRGGEREEEDDVERQVVGGKARPVGSRRKVGPIDDESPLLRVEAGRGRPLEEPEDGLGRVGEEPAVQGRPGAPEEEARQEAGRPSKRGPHAPPPAGSRG